MKLELDDKFWGTFSLFLAAFLGAFWVFNFKIDIPYSGSGADMAALAKLVIPDNGVRLPVVWGDMGKRLVGSGVIDQKKFEELYSQRGGMDKETKKLLSGTDNGNIILTKSNATTVLNLLWAFGLGNKNQILEKGPMTDKKYGGDAGKFASTGGWTLASGNTMNHYSRHKFIILSPEQQKLVETVSKKIYRPCCGNSAYFPDCNHGMAMLGLIELMAVQGINEPEMYKAALAANSFWFPDTYLTIATYFDSKGVSWDSVDPEEVLGENFSSARGYMKIIDQVQPPANGRGSSCGV